MNIEAIDQIVNGMKVYMPSGIQAELSMDDKGNIIVKYMDDCIDIYTPDEFIQVGTEGIIPVEEQSVLMEDKHTCCLDQLEFLSKHLKDTKLRQNAITLMDAAGLGVDVEEAVKKLWKEFKKNKPLDEKLDWDMIFKNREDAMSMSINTIDDVQRFLNLQFGSIDAMINSLKQKNIQARQDSEDSIILTFDNKQYKVKFYIDSLLNTASPTDIIEIKSEEDLVESTNEDYTTQQDIITIKNAKKEFDKLVAEAADIQWQVPKFIDITGLENSCPSFTNISWEDIPELIRGWGFTVLEDSEEAEPAIALDKAITEEELKEIIKKDDIENGYKSTNEDFGATGIIYPFRVICRDINGGAIDIDGHYKEKDAEEVFNDTVAENINDEVAEIALEKLEDGKYIKIKTWHPEDDWREVEFIEESLNEDNNTYQVLVGICGDEESMQVVSIEDSEEDAIERAKYEYSHSDLDEDTCVEVVWVENGETIWNINKNCEEKLNESMEDIVTVVDIPLVTEKLYNKLVNLLYGNKKDKNRDYEKQGNVLNFLQKIEDRIPFGCEFHTDLEDYGFTEDEINAIKKIVRDERVDESLNKKAILDKIKDILSKHGYKIDEFTSNGLWYCTIDNVTGNNDSTLVQGKDYTEVLKKIKKKFGESLDKKSILDKIAADVRAEVERVYDYDKDLIEWNYVEPHIKKGHYDDGSDMYYIEVRDELGYEGMQNLADKLNPIVRKYDKRAYFDMDEPGIMSAVIDMDTVKLDETSEEKAKGTEHKRIDNFVNSKLDNTDTKKNAKKLVKNSKIMAKRDDKKKDENMSELSKLTSELIGLMEEIDAEPKKCGLIDKLRKRFNKPEAKDEAFNDEIMLTDIEELDMPDALADTIDTNDEGEVLTLGDVADEIKDLKDEVIDAVAGIKDEITDKIEDKVEEEVDEIEFLDDMDAEAEEIEDEIKDTQEDAVDLEAEDAEEAAEAEDEEAGDEEIEEKEEEVEIEESFKKYLRKGQLENLQDAKQEIDRDIRSGADTEDIKTDITIHSDTEEEEKKAKEYAASKLKECLETSKTSILSKELK